MASNSKTPFVGSKVPTFPDLAHNGYVALAPMESGRILALDIGWVVVDSTNLRHFEFGQQDPNIEYCGMDMSFKRDSPTDAISMHLVFFDRNVLDKYLRGWARRYYAAVVESAVKNGSQVHGHKSVAVPQHVIADERINTETYAADNWSACFELLPGVRLANDRVITVEDGILVECHHTGEAEQISTDTGGSCLSELTSSSKDWTHRCMDCCRRY